MCRGNGGCDQALSSTVCQPPLLCHHVSPLLPPTFFFHPRPTFLVVVGVTIQHKPPHERHKAELGQILHAARITLEDRSLGALIAHPAHQVCFVCPVGSLSPTSAYLVIPFVKAG